MAFDERAVGRRIVDAVEQEVVLTVGANAVGRETTARGIARVALDTRTPVIYAVVTAETVEQAINRSGAKAGNRGGDAALAAIHMARAVAELRQTSPRKR